MYADDYSRMQDRIAALQADGVNLEITGEVTVAERLRMMEEAREQNPTGTAKTVAPARQLNLQ